MAGEDTDADAVYWVEVARLDAIDDSGRLCCSARGWQLLVLREGDEVYALENRCSHATARLDAGTVEGGQLICPLHGARFDIRSGACMGPPATKPIRSFPARVKGRGIEVELPARPKPAAPRYGVFN